MKNIVLRLAKVRKNSVPVILKPSPAKTEFNYQVLYVQDGQLSYSRSLGKKRRHRFWVQ